MDYLIHQSV